MGRGGGVWEQGHAIGRTSVCTPHCSDTLRECSQGPASPSWAPPVREGTRPAPLPPAESPHAGPGQAEAGLPVQALRAALPARYLLRRLRRAGT